LERVCASLISGVLAGLDSLLLIRREVDLTSAVGEEAVEATDFPAASICFLCSTI
jgi:hypothetical protein